MNRMNEEKRLAVLIDSDNISAKYAQFIMNEAQKYGLPTYKRVYGDWEKGGNGWHDPAINYSIMPVQQCSYIAGKNATDFSMIIDAMDILYSGRVDGFVLVTSDSDFTRLAIRLREAGMLVVGIGELKTPRAFTISCHHFCYLNQIGEPEGMQDEKTIRKAVISYVEENEGERIDLAKISAVLTSRFGNINFSELGYKRFSSFIDSFSELRRNNTFVSIRKKRSPQPEIVKKADKVTEGDIEAALTEYFAEHAPQPDNMLKIESYLNNRFGKIDFSQFGSSRFARFVDKLPGFSRTGTLIRPAVKTEPAPELSPETFRAEVISYAEKNMPEGGNVGQLNNYLMGVFGKSYFKTLGFADFKAALSSVGEVRSEGNRVIIADNKAVGGENSAADIKSVTAKVIEYAGANMPDGGNIGQLNNYLMSVFGRSYAGDLGYPDFKALLLSVPGVAVKKNNIYLVGETGDAPAEAKPGISSGSMPEIAAADVKIEPEKAPEKQPKKRGNAVRDKAAVPAEAELREPEKAEINAVTRDILEFAASAENGGALSELESALSGKYGGAFLKELGFTSMRKLVSSVNGIYIKNNKLYISEGFARQTEEIERYVNEFARGEGRKTVRALGIKLKERFEGFDFRNYGFARFTDFINAIDGVKADRYYISPIEEK